MGILTWTHTFPQKSGWYWINYEQKVQIAYIDSVNRSALTVNNEVIDLQYIDQFSHAAIVEPVSIKY